MLKDQKKETEVEKGGKKRKVVIKNMIGTEEEKEMPRRVKTRREAVTEATEMVNETEVETEEKRRVVRTEIGNEEKKKKVKRGEKQKDVKEAEIGTQARRGGKRGTTRIEEKTRQRTGIETRTENDGRKETDWIKKIKILTKTIDGEVIETPIEGRIGRKMK